MDRIIIIKHPEKIKELETEGARISWDELTCVGYPVSDDATEKLCQDIEKFRKKAGIEDSFIYDLPEGRNQDTLERTIQGKGATLNDRYIYGSERFKRLDILQ